jgi:hypothetical protein
MKLPWGRVIPASEGVTTVRVKAPVVAFQKIYLWPAGHSPVGMVTVVFPVKAPVNLIHSCRAWAVVKVCEVDVIATFVSQEPRKQSEITNPDAKIIS